MGVAPRGSFTTSPFGVKQNTWSVNISSLTCSRKSSSSSPSSNRSVIERSQRKGSTANGFSKPLAVPVGPVRRHAGLGDRVHLGGADLHLDALAVAARTVVWIER